MSIRIYTLAKKLHVGGDEILAVTELIGIKGKGSALAPLTDEEVIRVKSELDDPKCRMELKNLKMGQQKPAWKKRMEEGQTHVKKELHKREVATPFPVQTRQHVEKEPRRTETYYSFWENRAEKLMELEWYISETKKPVRSGITFARKICDR